MDVDTGVRFRDTSGQDQPLADGGRIRRRNKWLIAGGIGAVLVVVLAWIVPGAVGSGLARQSVSQSRLHIATVKRGNFVRDLVADGKVIAASSPTLVAIHEGTTSVMVRAGDVVARDQLLLRIEAPELKSTLAQERASLQSVQLELEHAAMSAQLSMEEARMATDRAVIDNNTAKRELARSEIAFNAGAYSELELLRAQDAVKKTEFALKMAERTMQARPRVSRLEEDSHKAKVARQQALVEDLQRRVDLLEVRSPVDGQVGILHVADRATVAEGAPLLTVVDWSALEVEIQVPESLARDLMNGVEVELSGNGKNWTGELSSVSPEVVTGQVTARIRFREGAPKGLRLNQRLSARIVLEKRANVLTVERGSFVDGSGGGAAYVVVDDVAERRPIRIGSVGADKVEVLEGLAPGDRIVVSGTEAFDGADRVILSR